MNKSIILVISALGVTLTACSSTQEIAYGVPDQAPSGTYMVSERAAQMAIRQPETVKEYAYNPYVDPNNPDVRYSEGVIHKVEQTPQWNLTPGVQNSQPKTANNNVAVATRQKVEDGPMEVVVNDQLISNKAVPAKLEQELEQERQYRKALAEQLQGQTELVRECAKQLADAKALAEENRQIRADLQKFKDAEEKRLADAKAKAAAAAAEQAKPWYQKWFPANNKQKKTEGK